MLERCPRCKYSLQGLPPEYACPECGLRYDARSEVWRRVHPKSIFLGLLGFAYGAYWVVQVVFHAFGRSPIRRAAVLTVVLLFLVAFVWVVVRMVMLYRRGLSAILTRDGLYLRLAQPEARLVPWSNVARVAVMPGRMRIGAVLFLKKERAVLDVVGVFKDRAAVQRFVETANAYIVEEARS